MELHGGHVDAVVALGNAREEIARLNLQRLAALGQVNEALAVLNDGTNYERAHLEAILRDAKDVLGEAD